MPDAIAMMLNINKHLKCIHSSVGYLRDQIQVCFCDLCYLYTCECKSPSR